MIKEIAIKGNELIIVHRTFSGIHKDDLIEVGDLEVKQDPIYSLLEEVVKARQNLSQHTFIRNKNKGKFPIINKEIKNNLKLIFEGKYFDKNLLQIDYLTNLLVQKYSLTCKIYITDQDIEFK